MKLPIKQGMKAGMKLGMIQGGGVPLTVPALINPLDAATGETTSSGAVTLDKSATVFQYISTSGTPPNATNLKSGSGSVFSDNQTGSAGTVNTVGSGLTENTPYFTHYIATNGAGDSNIVSASGFTTDAASGFTVADQTFDYGLDTVDEKGAFVVLATGGTIDFITIDSVTVGSIANWENVADNEIRLKAGNTFAASTVITCTATALDTSTDTFTATVTAIANEQTASSSAELDVAVGLMSVGDSLHARASGNYSAGFQMDKTGITGELTLRGDSNSVRTDLSAIRIKVNTATTDVKLLHLQFNDPTALGLGSAIFYSDAGDKLTVQNCSGTGPFTPDVNTNRTYWAKLDVDILAGSAPVIGRTLKEGAGAQNEIFDVQDNGGNNFTVWFNDQVVGTAAAWGLTDTLTESVSGNTYTVTAVRYGGLPASQKATAITPSGGLTWKEIHVIDCDFNKFTKGVFSRADDVIVTTNVTVTDCFEDSFKAIAITVSSPPAVTVTNAQAINFHSRPTDEGNPHTDGYQWDGSLVTVDWTGIVVENSKFIIGDTRSDGIQGVFLKGLVSTFFTANLRNILVVNKNMVNNIHIDRAKNCTIDNCTVAHADPDNATATININTVTDGGGNKARNNVSDAISLPGWTLSNNVILGEGGATISYPTAYAPSDFSSAPADLSEALTQYTPQGSGPLLDGATYVVGDTGCIDSNSNFFDWDPASIVDTTPPVFASSNPADGATGVSVTVNPTVTFTEENTLLFGTSKTFTIRDVSGSADEEVFSTATDIGSGPGKMSISSKTVTLEPTSDLSNSNNYSIRWSGGAVKDDSGNDVAANTGDTLVNWATASGAYTQNFVDNVGTGRLTASTAGETDTETLNVVMTFELDTNGITGTRIIYNPSGRTLIQLISGKLDVTIKNNSNVVIYDAVATNAFSTGVEYTLSILANMDGTPTVDITAGESAWAMDAPTVAATQGTIDHSRSSCGFLCLSTGSDSNAFDGVKISDFFVEFDAVRNASDFYSGGTPVDISSLGSPAFFIGATDTETQWNAGTNRGNLTLVSFGTFNNV